MNIIDYLYEGVNKCKRYASEDNGTLIGLPFPYTVPCVEGTFQEMYYWDTYFTNKGLIAIGDVDQAKNNVENMFYLVKKYGFMPNGNRVKYLKNSQPPFLSHMVFDIYNVTEDKVWLSQAYDVLKIEYDFWMSKRITNTGLNRYLGNEMPEGHDYTESARYLCNRIGFVPDLDDVELTKGCFAGCESGWDMNPRTSYKTHKYVTIDLNSLLYAMESHMSFFALELDKIKESNTWKQAAKKRADLCKKYLIDDGIYYDYEFEKCTNQKFASVANFYPLYCNLASIEEAKTAKGLLTKLETEFGVLTCEKNEIIGTYQWDYPNGWAPMQLIVIEGLINYGYKDDAKRIASKFIKMVDDVYNNTGHLWEKYNVLDGTIDVKNEYEMPTMMGWTFGVYIYLKKILENI